MGIPGDLYYWTSYASRFYSLLAGSGPINII